MPFAWPKWALKVAVRDYWLASGSPLADFGPPPLMVQASILRAVDLFMILDMSSIDLHVYLLISWTFAWLIWPAKVAVRPAYRSLGCL